MTAGDRSLLPTHVCYLYNSLNAYNLRISNLLFIYLKFCKLINPRYSVNTDKDCFILLKHVIKKLINFLDLVILSFLTRGAPHPNQRLHAFKIPARSQWIRISFNKINSPAPQLHSIVP